MPGRLDDGITGRISLERVDPPSRRTPCDTCRSRPGLYEMRWYDDSSPVRGLCQRCVDEELTTHQFDTARGMERLRASLLDAERQDDADLAQLAELHEERWSRYVEPPFVTAFIARHRRPNWTDAIARGIVRDDRIVDARIDAVRLDAARLALLVMRGGLAKYVDVRADAYLIADPNRLVTPEHAARILAERPKPIECRATVTAGYMGVQFTPRIAPQDVVVMSRVHSETWKKPQSVFDQLRAAHGDGYSSLLILCVGAGESRVIPVAAAESFSADFKMGSGFGIYAAAQCLARNPQLARDARAAGALYILTWPPGPWAPQIEPGNVITLRRGFDRSSAVLEYTPSVVATCESCGAEPAQWTLSDASTDPWIERRLGDACAAEVVAAGPGRDIEALEARLASDEQTDLVPIGRTRQRWLDGLVSPWIRLPMPPAVAQAVARLRALL